MNPQVPHGTPNTVPSDFNQLTTQNESILNRALHIQATTNTMCAIEYLKNNDIDSELICSTLLQNLRH